MAGSPTEPKAAEEVEEVEEAESEDDQDLYYIPQKTLDEIKEKLKGERKPEEFRALLDRLMDPEKVEDEELMVPLDMRAVGEDFESIEDMIEKLSPVGAAEAFLKAREHFEANKDNEPEEERPKPMKAKEWKKVLAEGEEEEDLLEDEEEGLEGGEEESVEEVDDEEEVEEEGAGEPPAKKAKTD